jgi:hypothetical protein
MKNNNNNNFMQSFGIVEYEAEKGWKVDGQSCQFSGVFNGFLFERISNALILSSGAVKVDGADKVAGAD